MRCRFSGMPRVQRAAGTGAGTDDGPIEARRRTQPTIKPAGSTPGVLATSPAAESYSLLEATLSNAMAKKRLRRRRRRPAADLEATYICDSCGEEIVVPVDISAGSHQAYVEDCPVCCHPMTLRIDIDPDGEAQIEGAHE